MELRGLQSQSDHRISFFFFLNKAAKAAILLKNKFQLSLVCLELRHETAHEDFSLARRKKEKGKKGQSGLFFSPCNPLRLLDSQLPLLFG